MDKASMDRLIKEALSLGRKTLVEPEAKEVLRNIGVAVPASAVVKDVTSAVEAAGRIGYPVVLKIVSPDIPHKTDIGGVALGLKNANDVEEKWSQMILTVAEENPVAMIEGFLVEKMVPKGAEVIIGVINDEQFGPVIMFGTGGAAVELMKDVSFRLSPVGKQDALDMMREVKGFPLLVGFRGATIKDLDAVADVIMKLSAMAEGTEGLKEFEINPLIVYEKGAIAVDARATLR